MKLGDSLLGTLVAVCGAALVAASFGFREMPGQPISAGFFPRLIGFALVGVGLLLAVSAADRRLVGRSAAFARRGPWPAVLLVAGIGLWILLVQPMGFVAATALLIFGTGLLLGGRFSVAAMVAPPAAIVLYYLFAVALRVPLPRSAIETMLP